MTVSFFQMMQIIDFCVISIKMNEIASKNYSWEKHPIHVQHNTIFRKNVEFWITQSTTCFESWKNVDKKQCICKITLTFICIIILNLQTEGFNQLINGQNNIMMP